MHSRRQRLLSRRREALSPAVMLGGKHPPLVRAFDMIERTVLLADGAVLPLDDWMRCFDRREDGAC